MMKKIIVLILVSIGAFAQEQQTLFGSKNAVVKINKVGLYISPEAQFTKLNGSSAGSMGMAGILVFNEKLSLGLVGSGMANTATDTTRTSAMMAGLRAEYTLKASKVFHVGLQLTAGSLAAGLNSSNSELDFFDDHRGRGSKDGRSNYNRGSFDNHGFLQPALVAEVNLFKYAKVYASAAYRAVLGNNIATLPNSSLSGLGLNIGAKVGVFDLNSKVFKRHK